MKGSSVEKKKDKRRRTSTPSKYVPSNKKGYGWLWGLLVVIVVAAIVAVGIYMGVKSNRDSENGADIAIKHSSVKVTENYIEFRSNNAKKDAKIIELFEDPRCPGCSELEKMHGAELADAIQSDQVVLRLRLMDFLNSQGASQYSTRANAALITVALTGDAESAFRFHSILWHTAPAEGGGVPEPTNAELAEKAKMAGAKGETLSQIKSGNFGSMRAATMGRVNLKVLNERMDGKGGTPAAFMNGGQIDLSRPDWVTSLYTTNKK